MADPQITGFFQLSLAQSWRHYLDIPPQKLPG
jgi:hypothetical protein